MASAEQIKALLKSHITGDHEPFPSVTMQVRAHEPRLGHGKLAVELRALVDEAKNGRGPRSLDNLSAGRSRVASSSLLETSYPEAPVREMILSDTLAEQFDRLIHEQRHASRVIELAIVPRSKILLVGPPGDDETMTASVLTGELGLALLKIRLDGLMSGTWERLPPGSDRCSTPRGACGSCTSSMDSTPSACGAAQRRYERNPPGAQKLSSDDRAGALFFRFDEVLHHDLSDEAEIAKLLRTRWGRNGVKGISWSRFVPTTERLSHADTALGADQGLKDIPINSRPRRSVRQRSRQCLKRAGASAAPVQLRMPDVIGERAAASPFHFPRYDGKSALSLIVVALYPTRHSGAPLSIPQLQPVPASRWPAQGAPGEEATERDTKTQVNTGHIVDLRRRP